MENLQSNCKQQKKAKKKTKTKKPTPAELQFLCTALFLGDIYPPMKFHDNTSYTFGVVVRTKFKYRIEQRAITQTLSHA